MKSYFLLVSIFISLSFSAQREDGWLKLNQYKTAVLNDSLKENSGLNFFQNKLLTFNDSGNTSDIFEIDKNSGKIKEIFKTNLQNIDWESITSDSTNIYIGDFGNNHGNRKDLKIYKIPFDDLEKASEFKNIKEIPFYYPEQQEFTPKNLNTNFDGEAMIFLNGKLHLFTKEWRSKATSHYIADPEISTIQAAKKTEEFNTGFVVTDATYFDKNLYLIGYTKNTEVFLSIFKETRTGFFFENPPKKYYLGSALSIGQIEGITADESGIYISGEEFVTPLGTAKPRLYFVPYDKLK